MPPPTHDTGSRSEPKSKGAFGGLIARLLALLRLEPRRQDGQRAGSGSVPWGLFTSSPAAVLVHRGGRIFAANPAAALLFGYPSVDALHGVDIRDICANAEMRTRFEERLKRVHALARGQVMADMAFRLRHRSGRELHVRVTSTKDIWQGREAVISHYVDSTAEVWAQDALKRSESLLEGIFKASPFAMSVSDPETGRYHMVNAAYGRMFGHSVADLMGQTALDTNIWAGGPEQRNRVLNALRAADADGQVFFDEQLRHADGHVVHAFGAASFVGEAERQHLVFIGTDVTTARREHEELRAIMDNAPVCILVTEGGRVRSASPLLRELAGLPDLQPVGMRVADLWHDEVAYDEIRSEVARQLAATGRCDVVRPHTRPDGSTIQMRVQGSPLPVEAGDAPAMVWILSDLTARMDAFRGREVAEAASRAKTAFLAMMSHELRTPLNGVLGLAELARSKDTRAAERREYLNQLADCANSLADILNDILDLSKIEAGRMDLELRAVELSDFFQRLHATYTSLAEARGLDFRVELDPRLPASVMADATRLRQVMANFLGNALKFTARGSISLRAKVHDHLLRFEVEDTGKGIDEELLPRLFNPFEQARDIGRHQSAGTGLGLAICRQLAGLMGGDVGVHSELGQGSRFWIDIPLRRPDAQALSRTLEAAGRQDVDLTGVKVLLAEDNEINALITMRALASAGATARRVSDGQAAVDEVEAAYAQDEPYAVVLMDVQMPVMDGLQATRELRARPSGARLHILALTAGALAEQREECRQAGMDGHLTKPLHRDRLLAEVWLHARLGAADQGPMQRLSF